MNSFTADVGTYESGQRINLKAKTLDAAIKKASKELKSMDEWADVVQIYFNGNIVWDFMNGKIGECP